MNILFRNKKIVIATCVSAALLLGCGSSSPSGAVDTDASRYGSYGKTEDISVPADTTTSQIVIEGSAFSIADNVMSSDALSVTNRDGFTHTVTSDDGAFDVTVAGGTTISLPSLKSGTYAFHCKIHSSMMGTLTVG